MKKYSLLIFYVVTNFCFAQQKEFAVVDLPPKTENTVFPMIKYPLDKKVEEKMNLYLQVSELENIPNTRKNPFQLAITATNSYTNYVYFFEWNKLETPKNILSIMLNGEATGAYPENFTNWRNFDIRTGNLINAKDLFLPESKKIIESKIQKVIIKRINDHIAPIKSSKNPSEDDLDVLSIYDNCYTEYTLDGLDYNFEKDKIVFVAGRCSNHAMRALDDLGSHVVEFSHKELEKHLSSFGKNLLSGSNTVGKTSFDNKIFKGSIDKKYPITMLVHGINEDGSFSADYWYNKEKKIINWRGEISNDHLSIIEDDYHDENLKRWIPKANIEADIKGNKILGTWQNFKTKKYYTLELEEL